MNYFETIQWIFNRMPLYQEQGLNAYKHTLNGIKSLCNYLGEPQLFFKSIHIGGTNGKGSTASMLASILQESHYRVGLFTSPHLKNFSERILCNNKFIEKNFIVTFIKQHKKFLEENELSFFELITGLAFSFFKEKKIDIGVIEVGMGGRFDSTNIISPIISIITHIGFDHIDILGNTIYKIAYEKAGIIKPYIPVIIGSSVSGTEKIFLEIAQKQNAPIFFVRKEKRLLYKIPLLGNYQVLNQSTVLKTIEILRNLNIDISEKSLLKGFKNVLINTHFKGRWQYIEKFPKIICDIAHNEDGIYYVAKQLEQESYQNLHLVLGFVVGKQVLKILSYFPIEAYYYFCEPNIPRKFSIDILKKITKGLYKNSMYLSTVTEAFSLAKKKAKEEDLIFIGGSTFVVSEII